VMPIGAAEQRQCQQDGVWSRVVFGDFSGGGLLPALCQKPSAVNES
jgi:hypothetical protein